MIWHLLGIKASLVTRKVQLVSHSRPPYVVVTTNSIVVAQHDRGEEGGHGHHRRSHCYLFYFVSFSKEKKRQALEDIHNMKHTVPIKRKDEESINGLVIINGVYGKIKRDSDKRKKRHKVCRRASLSTLNEETTGEVSTMDATVPLQCMVDRSHLVIPAGESKAWLSGFYDPCLGEQKQLCVRYMFWGRLHEVTINDDEELKIPLKAHLLGPEVTFVSEGDERGVIELLEEIYGRLCETRLSHRLFALTSFAALGMVPSMIERLLAKYN